MRRAIADIYDGRNICLDVIVRTCFLLTQTWTVRTRIVYTGGNGRTLLPWASATCCTCANGIVFLVTHSSVCTGIIGIRATSISVWGITIVEVVQLCSLLLLLPKRPDIVSSFNDNGYILEI